MLVGFDDTFSDPEPAISISGLQPQLACLRGLPELGLDQGRPTHCVRQAELVRSTVGPVELQSLGVMRGCPSHASPAHLEVTQVAELVRELERVVANTKHRHGFAPDLLGPLLVSQAQFHVGQEVERVRVGDGLIGVAKQDGGKLEVAPGRLHDRSSLPRRQIERGAARRPRRLHEILGRPIAHAVIGTLTHFDPDSALKARVGRQSTRAEGAGHGLAARVAAEFRMVRPREPSGVRAIAAARREVLARVEALSAEAVVRRPPGGGWSVAEIVEHLVRAEEYGMRGLWASLPNSGDGPRPLDAGLASRSIDEIFRDLPARVDAPPGVLPQDGGQPAGYWVARLRSHQAMIAELARVMEEVGLDRVIYPHYIAGPLDGHQRLQFFRWHLQRHLMQIGRTVAAIPSD